MSVLVFKPSVAKDKPTNKDACPFCNVEMLNKIIDMSEEFIWLENKYQTIENTFQTVLIESNDHLGDISNYSYDYNRNLFQYSISKMMELEKKKEFKSVIMFRNFGPLSGGTLRHPHLQIVGFKNINAYSEIVQNHFYGLNIITERNDKPEINLSLNPIMGFCEFNVIISNLANVNCLADGIKEVVSYVLNHYWYGLCDSYNLFFYKSGEKIICKIVPRFITSPYYVGYKLSQLNEVVILKKVKDDFLNRCIFDV